MEVIVVSPHHHNLSVQSFYHWKDTTFLSHCHRTISNFSFELFSLECAIDGFAILIEHTVRTNFVFLLWSGSCIEINAKQCGKQQENDAKFQFDGDHPTSRPETKIQNVCEIGETWPWFGRCCGSNFFHAIVFVGCWTIDIGRRFPVTSFTRIVLHEHILFQSGKQKNYSANEFCLCFYELTSGMIMCSSFLLLSARVIDTIFRNRSFRLLKRSARRFLLL